MYNYETPNSFNLRIQIQENEIEYRNLNEIGQGGPEVGFLYINGEKVSNDYFGGPLLNNGKFIFLPQFSRRLLGSKFEIVAINIETKNKFILNGSYDLIHLDSIKNGRIYFYTDIEKSSLKSIEIP